VHLADRVRIGPYCVLDDVSVGPDTVVHANCVVHSARIGAHCQIGPFTRLRPQAQLADGVHLGGLEVKVADARKVLGDGAFVTIAAHSDQAVKLGARDGANGALLQRALVTIASYFFYRNIGVGLAFDREAIADQFRFARFVLPSSLLTIVLSQYDKVVLLKLFNLTLLGIYGIAGNMLGPINGVIVHNARVVLYARCAEYFRTDRATARDRYYEENRRLFMVGVMLPAMVAGFSQSIVAILYDPRYAMVGPILMILGLGAVITAFQSTSENLLVASGRTHIVLVANVIRLCSVIPATFFGYYLFGFYGFLWFNLAATIPLLMYFYYEQRKFNLLNLKKEVSLLGTALLVFLLCLAASHLLLASIPPGWLHLGLKKH